MSTLYRYGVWFAKGMREYTKGGYEKAKGGFKSLEGCKVDGRSYMITGANSGIGKEVALAIAKHGGTVHIVCRNETRGEEALNDIKTQSKNEDVYLHILDISQPTKVYEFIDRFQKENKPLNVLINNAGCMTNKRTVNSDDLEVNFATNTLGTYILTTGFIDYLKNYEQPQVITVTSGGMLLVKLDYNDLQFEHMKPFDGAMAYSHNKRQQVVMTDYWSKTHKEIQFTTMHPGWADTPAVQTSMADFHKKMEGRLRSPEEGADTLVWLSLSPNARNKERSGEFYQDRVAVKKHLPLAWTQNNESDEKQLMEKLKEIAGNIKSKI